MLKGSLILVLHAHMPYVRHPENERFLEERWLYDAAFESYIPLLDMLLRLEGEGVDYALALSLSPTLLEMLSDPLIVHRLEGHIEWSIGLSEKEVARTGKDPVFAPLARMYLERAKRALELFRGDFGRDLPGAFRRLFSSGRVEPLTTAATHAFLPLLEPFPEAVSAQVSAGVSAFERLMGRRPAGFWLPECGYYRGLEEAVSEAGAGYFFLDSHGVLNAKPRPNYGIFRPISSPSGPAVFGRDASLSRLVWSSASGYPGDPLYRDFHRDIGYDLPMRYIGPYVQPDGKRTPTGIKYWAVSNRPYEKEAALLLARRHADDFLRRVEEKASGLSGRYSFSPLMVAAFDAELFGHWWFEGIEWLEHVLRGSSLSPVRAVGPSEYLCENPGLQQATPSPSSWGRGGYASTWLNGKNSLAARRIHRAWGLMRRLCMKDPAPPGIGERALGQALKELMLASASDWPFLLDKGSHAGYAWGRLDGHLANFDALVGMLSAGRPDGALVSRLEEAAPVFRGWAWGLT